MTPMVPPVPGLSCAAEPRSGARLLTGSCRSFSRLRLPCGRSSRYIGSACGLWMTNGACVSNAHSLLCCYWSNLIFWKCWWFAVGLGSWCSPAAKDSDASPPSLTSGRKQISSKHLHAPSLGCLNADQMVKLSMKSLRYPILEGRPQASCSTCLAGSPTGAPPGNRRDPWPEACGPQPAARPGCSMWCRTGCARFLPSCRLQGCIKLQHTHISTALPSG